ncbi:MAG: bile acid:sodium symporter family protein [Gemmataceae bacterium]
MLTELFELYPKYEQVLAQIQLVLFMLGMGVTLSLSDFAPVFRQPAALLYGLTVELVVTPFLALLVGWVAGLETGLAFGLLLIAALPGGTLSNAFTYLSRSNVALSIALSATATLIAIATIPLVLRFLSNFLVTGDDVAVGSQFEMPVLGIVREISFFLLLPLGIGMWLARIAPDFRQRISLVCLILGFVFVGIMVVGAIGASRIEVGEHGWRAPIAILAFCILTQQCAMLPIRFSGWPTRDWVAVGIEATIRNVYLGILLATLLFPASESSIGKQVMFVVLFYGPASIGAALPLTLRIRRWHGKEQSAAKLPAATPAEI